MSLERFRRWAALAALAVFLSGCRATQVANDGINCRQALLTMYDEQVMDNLIRAHNNQGFVQLKYSDLLIQVTDQYFGELTNAQTLANGKSLNIAAPVSSALGMLTHSFQNVFTLHGSSQRLGQMSFHADPVTDSNDVYKAYIDFAKNPELFVVTDHKPEEAACHKVLKSCGQYYYVPIEAAPLFQELVMKTTFMHGPETVAPGYYQSKVVRIKRDNSPNRQAIVELDKPIPKGRGELVFGPPTGGRLQLVIQPVGNPEPDEKDRAPGEMTVFFDVRWRPTDPISAVGLVGATVRIYLDDYPPELNQTPTTDVQQIRQGVDRVRSALSPFLRPPGT